jgi:hypothetical protein
MNFNHPIILPIFLVIALCICMSVINNKSLSLFIALMILGVAQMERYVNYNARDISVSSVQDKLNVLPLSKHICDSITTDLDTCKTDLDTCKTDLDIYSADLNTCVSDKQNIDNDKTQCATDLQKCEQNNPTQAVLYSTDNLNNIDNKTECKKIISVGDNSGGIVHMCVPPTTILGARADIEKVKIPPNHRVILYGLLDEELDTLPNENETIEEQNTGKSNYYYGAKLEKL